MGFSVLTARETKQEPKNESGGRGRARKETLADKPLVLSGWFSKSRGLSASVSFLSSPPLLALLLAPFFARSLTLVPRSLFLNHTEMLATQANLAATWYDSNLLAGNLRKYQVLNLGFNQNDSNICVNNVEIETKDNIILLGVV